MKYYITYIIKKHGILPTYTPIHIYINRINNRLVSKIKGRYKLELQTLETMKLFDSTKQLIGKTKNCKVICNTSLYPCFLLNTNILLILLM